jgi:hypothetical protein
MLNVLGFLYDRRYVSRRDSLTLWATSASRVHKSAVIAGSLALRDSQEDGHGDGVWPFFRDFAAAAEAQ